MHSTYKYRIQVFGTFEETTANSLSDENKASIMKTRQLMERSREWRGKIIYGLPKNSAISRRLAYIDGIILNELDITWSKVVVA
jgi:hypothetical protein